MSKYGKKVNSPVMRIRGIAAGLACLLAAGFPVQVLAQDGDCSLIEIYLTSQTQVDNFQSDYGPCSRVIGDLYIEDYDPGVDDITDLSPLLGLQEVGGSLTISNNPILTSLTGLENLASVTHLYVSGHASLTSLEGFSGLTSVSTLEIIGNVGLQDLGGLPSSLQSLDLLYIGGNPFLVDLQGLPETLTQVRRLFIWDHFNLVSLEGLPAITNLELIWIENNEVLSDLGGLANSAIATADPEETAIYIAWNFGLTDLQGLPPVVKLGNLDVNNNPNLTSLAGLEALQEIWGGLTVRENQGLSDCSILTTVLDAVDDGDPGPGTGVDPADPPDTPGLESIDIVDNLPGCDSLEEILAGSDDVIHADGFESS